MLSISIIPNFSEMSSIISADFKIFRFFSRGRIAMPSGIQRKQAVS